MTFREIEEKVRTLVNDAKSPHRFTDSQIWGFATDAVRRLRTINPSERYGENGLLDDSIPSEVADADVRIDPRHHEAVIMYVAAKAYELDMTDTVNLQTANVLLSRAESMMAT